jgi:hypothetical protein
MFVAAAPGLAATSRPEPVPVSLDGWRTSFYNYDFTSPAVSTDNQSWPVNLIFQGNASELKIKAALTGAFPWPGSAEYGRVSQGSRASWDVDLGRKSRICGSLTAPSVHYRLYSPPLLGRFLSPDPLLRRYVVGTAHLDIGECGSAPVYGYSEEAEEAVAAAAKSRGWTVEEDRPDRNLVNTEELGWEGNRFFDNNGLATVITVP